MNHFAPARGLGEVVTSNPLLNHLGDNNLRDGPDLAILAACQARVGSLLGGGDGLAEASIGPGEGDLGVDVTLFGNGRAAVVIALGTGAVTPHEWARLVLERTELLAGIGIGDGLAPGVVVRQQLVHDLDLLVCGYGACGAVKLAEGTEERGAHAPLTLNGAAPRVVGPGFEGSLDKIAGAV